MPNANTRLRNGPNIIVTGKQEPERHPGYVTATVRIINVIRIKSQEIIFTFLKLS